MEGKKRRTKNPLDAQKVFPRRLTKLMKDRKITRSALAEKLGVTRQAVANYCDGSSTPSWEGIAEIARFFSCSSDYLLGLSEFSSHSLEQITLAELGLNEATIENLEFYCKAVTSFHGKESPKTKDGVNLLLGNDSIWESGMFPEIARLKQLVPKVGKDIDDLYSRGLNGIKRGEDYYCCDLNLREGYRLNPMEYLNYCITNLGNDFVNIVKSSIGYNEIFDPIGHPWLFGTVYGKSQDETEE